MLRKSFGWSTAWPDFFLLFIPQAYAFDSGAQKEKQAGPLTVPLWSPAATMIPRLHSARMKSIHTQRSIAFSWANSVSNGSAQYMALLMI